MQIGVIGLGRMGGNIVRRLMRAGHSCVVYDANPGAGTGAGQAKARSPRLASPTLVESAGAQPRTVWVMLPAGKITEDTIARARRPDDGGRHHHRRRQHLLQGRRPPRQGTRSPRASTISTSARRAACGACERGYCLMIGGDKAAVDAARSDLRGAGAGASARSSAPAGRDGLDPRAEQGYIHAGPVGAGHFVKMIHNGIEYGMMQAYRRGLRHPEATAASRQAAGRRALRSQPRRHRRSLAARQRHHLLAARPDGGGARQGRRARAASPATSRIPARAAGRSRRRSRRRCRPTCWPPRCSCASARASTIPSRRRCCRPCASASAATSSRPRIATKK